MLHPGKLSMQWFFTRWWIKAGRGNGGGGGWAEINLIDRQLNQGVEFTWELL